MTIDLCSACARAVAVELKPEYFDLMAEYARRHGGANK